MAARRKAAPKRNVLTEPYPKELEERDEDDPRGMDDPELIDPNVVIESPGHEYAYVRLPGMRQPVRYDKITLVIEPIGPMYGPIRLPKPFSDVPQPFVHTCTIPIPGQNLGCLSSNGCPFRLHPWLGQFNIIMHQDGTYTVTTCDKYWHGVNAARRPVSNHHYKLDGWDLVLDRTTVPADFAVTDKDGKLLNVETREVEVPNLGPMYWKLLRKKGLPLPEWASSYKKVPGPVGGRGVPLPMDVHEQALKNYVASHPTSAAEVVARGAHLASQRESGRLKMAVPEL